MNNDDSTVCVRNILELDVHVFKLGSMQYQQYFSHIGVANLQVQPQSPHRQTWYVPVSLAKVTQG